MSGGNLYSGPGETTVRTRPDPLRRFLISTAIRCEPNRQSATAADHLPGRGAPIEKTSDNYPAAKGSGLEACVGIVLPVARRLGVPSELSWIYATSFHN